MTSTALAFGPVEWPRRVGVAYLSKRKGIGIGGIHAESRTLSQAAGNELTMGSRRLAPASFPVTGVGGRPGAGHSRIFRLKTVAQGVRVSFVE